MTEEIRAAFLLSQQLLPSAPPLSCRILGHECDVCALVPCLPPCRLGARGGLRIRCERFPMNESASV
eukprot:4790759-Prorocentrum_lima.AAC.1